MPGIPGIPDIPGVIPDWNVAEAGLAAVSDVWLEQDVTSRMLAAAMRSMTFTL
jgi:hypothetical protein